MIYSKEYLNMYLSIRHSLHIGNVEKLSIDQLRHIGKTYEKELFEHYKKVVFLKWVHENIENKISFYNRVNKLMKKLNVELSDSEMSEIKSIEAREFTERRAFKTIEVPYKDNDKALLLLPNAFFFYKGIRTFKRRKLLFEKMFEGEIYITSNEIVLYDREANDIQMIIPHRTINGIKFKSEYVEIIRTLDKESVFFRYKDNELIYISLKRAVHMKNVDGFKDEHRSDFITTERTIESFLNLNRNDYVKKTSSKIKRKESIRRKDKSKIR